MMISDDDGIYNLLRVQFKKKRIEQPPNFPTKLYTENISKLYPFYISSCFQNYVNNYKNNVM